MASKKFQKGSMEFEMFTEYWKLCQKHWIPEDKDKYWEALIQDITDFERKYGMTGLARKLGNALARDIEERYKSNEDVGNEAK